ncbi:uncharacterized protein ANIA_11100 [Aspergillus nidulans FGSC A4]|uniref:Uncharacterized protein n=1 Tax=Emericella nidulans (strain FGSC A4 / ATCC 38163 / CBS 112.46 / NRRL 194 / M139) TaxID=227321 RepID=C8VAF5_EMENI|nr:hypothetical protein [Aspergillus nidulans FGSC A4]CBF78326.1 TPA: conserved hypothetical protein [Aspergillus nidulans FGSC A4]
MRMPMKTSGNARSTLERRALLKTTKSTFLALSHITGDEAKQLGGPNLLTAAMDTSHFADESSESTLYDRPGDMFSYNMQMGHQTLQVSLDGTNSSLTPTDIFAPILANLRYIAQLYPGPRINITGAVVALPLPYGYSGMNTIASIHATHNALTKARLSASQITDHRPDLYTGLWVLPSLQRRVAGWFNKTARIANSNNVDEAALWGAALMSIYIAEDDCVVEIIPGAQSLTSFGKQTFMASCINGDLKHDTTTMKVHLRNISAIDYHAKFELGDQYVFDPTPDDIYLAEFNLNTACGSRKSSTPQQSKFRPSFTSSLLESLEMEYEIDLRRLVGPSNDQKPVEAFDRALFSASDQLQWKTNWLSVSSWQTAGQLKCSTIPALRRFALFALLAFDRPSTRT